MTIAHNVIIPPTGPRIAPGAAVYTWDTGTYDVVDVSSLLTGTDLLVTGPIRICIGADEKPTGVAWEVSHGPTPDQSGLYRNDLTMDQLWPGKFSHMVANGSAGFPADSLYGGNYPDVFWYHYNASYDDYYFWKATGSFQTHWHLDMMPTWVIGNGNGNGIPGLPDSKYWAIMTVASGVLLGSMTIYA